MAESAVHAKAACVHLARLGHEHCVELAHFDLTRPFRHGLFSSHDPCPGCSFHCCPTKLIFLELINRNKPFKIWTWTLIFSDLDLNFTITSWNGKERQSISQDHGHMIFCRSSQNFDLTLKKSKSKKGATKNGGFLFNLYLKFTTPLDSNFDLTLKRIKFKGILNLMINSKYHFDSKNRLIFLLYYLFVI
ncbi:hypothetical protein BpHYR1_000278 [Brachionus plicatilis]|uniref:Uncharacterized protein n=1 Tax=Brachionus plicatilis TaxID=10195 RepID=A0A3M7TCQ4_BRAPC|nr:hypothetical protein BpHYR1_000278 [Brachionus plicatilis]